MPLPRGVRQQVELFIKIRLHCQGTPPTLLEQASASPQMGVVSAFTYGQGVGVLLGILETLDYQYDLVTPSVWQRELLGQTSKGDKAWLVEQARSLCPTVEGITRATADALLIAALCRRRCLSRLDLKGA